jgi:hypothetical protein
MRNFDSKVNNYLFDLIFETPDTVKFVDSTSGRTVNLNTMVGQPHVFGFFDANCEVSLKSGEKVKLFSKELQRYNHELVVIQSNLRDKITHFDCILKLMKDISTSVQGSKTPVIINVPQVQVSLDMDAPQDPTPESVKAVNIANPEEYRKARLYNLPQREVFMLSGRYWDNVRDAKGKYGVLSFWQFEDFVANHKNLVSKLMDEIGLFPDEYNNIYVEFMGQNDPKQPRHKLSEFMSGTSKAVKVSKVDREKAIKAKSIPHELSGVAGVGKLKNQSFGAATERDRAQKAGAGSVAEWKAKRTQGD